MSNDATRAKAEGLPEGMAMMATPNRRTALAMTGAGLAAALTSFATHAATPSRIAALIEEHRAAWKALDDACTDVGDIEEAGEFPRREIFVPLSISGGQSERADDDLSETAAKLRASIVKRYAEVRLSPVEHIAPAVAEKAKAALRSARAADLRSMRQMIRDEHARREASGYAQALRARDAANDAEVAALDAVLNYRCATMPEINAKADYLAEFYVTTGRYVMDEFQAAALLMSMKTEG